MEAKTKEASMSPKQSSKWTSIRDSADQLSVHPATICRQAKKKNIPIAKVGGA
jgi:hypothetical protein